MSAGAQISFQLRQEGYATLTLEAVQVEGINQVQSPLPPPFVQPVLDAGSGGQSVPPGPSQAMSVSGTRPGNTGRFSRPWLVWLWNVWRYITQANNQLSILAPSVDETDIGWYATAHTSVNDTTDPLTLTVDLVGLQKPRTGGFNGTGPEIFIADGGTGHTSGAVITVASSNGQGQPALFTAVVAGGVVVGTTQTTQGYNLAAPLVVTIAAGGTGFTATATLGRQFAVGDFIVWNDPTIPSGKNYYSYEIDQITAITPINDTSFTCVLERGGASSGAGQAQYGSLLSAHSSGAALYRLINKEFFTTLDVSAGPQVLKFLWDNMTVAAIALNGASLSGSSVMNLAPVPYLSDGVSPNTRSLPPAPGYRTMNGAAYTTLGINGTLSVGNTSQNRISVQAWESIRTVYAKVLTAPVGATAFHGNANAAIVLYVIYIPLGATMSTVCGLIDTLVIDTRLYNSFSLSPNNQPDGRQMPYHPYWPPIAPNYDWPPNNLVGLTGALTAGLLLQNGFTVSTTQSVIFAPDGEIDFIVAQVGTSTPGADLIVTGQT